MKQEGLSPTARALFDAARSDAPNAAARAQIWSAVSGANIAASAVAPSVPVSVAGTSAKGMSIASIFGGVVAVGSAALLLYATHSSSPNSNRVGEGARGGPPQTISRELASESPSANGNTPLPATSAEATPLASVSRLPPRHAKPLKGVDDDSFLMREASLVAEARGALMRGEASVALAASRAAQNSARHDLEPEELSIQVQALRALGREGEASDVEAVLRTRYPEHALSR